MLNILWIEDEKEELRKYISITNKAAGSYRPKSSAFLLSMDIESDSETTIDDIHVYKLTVKNHTPDSLASRAAEMTESESISCAIIDLNLQGLNSTDANPRWSKEKADLWFPGFSVARAIANQIPHIPLVFLSKHMAQIADADWILAHLATISKRADNWTVGLPLIHMVRKEDSEDRLWPTILSATGLAPSSESILEILKELPWKVKPYELGQLMSLMALADNECDYQHALREWVKKESIWHDILFQLRRFPLVYRNPVFWTFGTWIYAYETINNSETQVFPPYPSDPDKQKRENSAHKSGEMAMSFLNRELWGIRVSDLNCVLERVFIKGKNLIDNVQVNLNISEQDGFAVYPISRCALVTAWYNNISNGCEASKCVRIWGKQFEIVNDNIIKIFYLVAIANPIENIGNTIEDYYNRLENGGLRGMKYIYNSMQAVVDMRYGAERCEYRVFLYDIEPSLRPLGFSEYPPYTAPYCCVHHFPLWEANKLADLSRTAVLSYDDTTGKIPRLPEEIQCDLQTWLGNKPQFVSLYALPIQPILEVQK